MSGRKRVAVTLREETVYTVEIEVDADSATPLADAALDALERRTSLDGDLGPSSAIEVEAADVTIERAFEHDPARVWPTVKQTGRGLDVDQGYDLAAATGRRWSIAPLVDGWRRGERVLATGVDLEAVLRTADERSIARAEPPGPLGGDAA